MANPRNTRSGCAGVRFAPSRERDQALTIPFAEGGTEIKKLYCICKNNKIYKNIHKIESHSLCLVINLIFN